MTKKKYASKRNFFSKCFEKIKCVDMYGKNIVLTYNGAEKYKTCIGGVASFFVGLTIAAYIAYLLYVMFEKVDTNVATNSAYEDIFTDVKIHKPAERNFDFAISLVADGVDYIGDTSAFTVTMKEVAQVWNGTSQGSSFNRTKTSIPFQKCGREGLNYDNFDEIERLGIDEYYCAKEDNYTIAGSYFAKEFDYLELKVNK